MVSDIRTTGKVNKGFYFLQRCGSVIIVSVQKIMARNFTALPLRARMAWGWVASK